MLPLDRCWQGSIRWRTPSVSCSMLSSPIQARFSVSRQRSMRPGAMAETLRRYPVAGGHNARVAKPLTIAGYRLEPGNTVQVAMTVPHFLEELYPHPMQFDIDRFREPRNEHRQRGAYAPFGLGDHTCLGAGIAEVQMMVTMAVLLHTHTLQFDPPG